ncbi:MAG: S41 family peptidase [Acidobacteriota bacterium]|nr:S41 family peptidase [Acidobacteriota bacterium]
MRSRLIFLALSLLLVLPILTGTLDARDQDGDDDALFKHLSVFTEVLGLVRDAYVEPSDEGELMVGAVDGATDALDPFSVYVPAEGIKSYSAVRTVGDSHSGLMLVRERGVVFVVGVTEGSPADQAGLRLGDVVAEIGGEPTFKTPMWKIQSFLAQEPGTKVTLDVLRSQEHQEREMVLGTFEAPASELRIQDGAAVMRIYRFDTGTTAEVTAALEQARSQNLDRLLVDLRGVAGGSVETAYRVAALFADGELGGLRARANELVSFRGAEPRWQGKVVVLVDRGTLGAAEILATVLRQKLEADLVGERTFGYAGRLKRVELSTGGHLWLTDAFYTGPDDAPLQESLSPDVAVRDTLRNVEDLEDESEEAEDAIFDRGLEQLLSDEDEPAEQQAA